MGKKEFQNILQKELDRLDGSNISKRFERVIEGFSKEENRAPKAVVEEKEFMIFNSNDYLGLRFHKDVLKAEEEASQKYGSGPGAVRFISGSLKVYQELEKELAIFHKAEAAITFSSSFAANLAVIHCFIKGQSRDSAVGKNTLVISDELNHRSIIDGIRVAGMLRENKAIFRHLDYEHLREILEENKGKFSRVLVISDGVFSMIGEYADLKKINEVSEEFDEYYNEGILTIIDDAHGVGAFGENGRGCQDISQARPDILVATMGKGFGADGGYVVGDKIYIDYLRESAATYIYSNPVSPGTAGAAVKSLKIIQSEEGQKLLRKLKQNMSYFKQKMDSAGFEFAADSIHPIQPVLIGDPAKTRALTNALFDRGILVTQISYPVVPKGKDEIRVQMSAAHSKEDLDEFIKEIIEAGKESNVI